MPGFSPTCSGRGRPSSRISACRRAVPRSRVYRREDVERVLRIRHLLLVEGLTLAGVRRRLEEEAEPPLADEPFAARCPWRDASTRERIGRREARPRARPARHSLDAVAVHAGSAARSAARCADFALAAARETAAAAAKASKRGVRGRNDALASAAAGIEVGRIGRKSHSVVGFGQHSHGHIGM